MAREWGHMGNRGFQGSSSSAVLLPLIVVTTLLLGTQQGFSQAQSIAAATAIRPAAVSSATPQPVNAGPNKRDENAKTVGLAVLARSQRPDTNREIFYRNKLEFSFEMGYLPQNIPFPFDFLLGGGYNKTPLKYTLMPMLASLRWETNDIGGPWIFRGNWEMSFTACVTPIPRGPETHYTGYVMGIRRNLVRPNWRATPFAEFRAGLGNEDAKEPKGVVWAQGQDFAFTLMIDSGVRYRISPKYAIWAGVQWMHISNLYMSEPRYPNYGINVYGPVIGLDVALRMHRIHQVH